MFFRPPLSFCQNKERAEPELMVVVEKFPKDYTVRMPKIPVLHMTLRASKRRN